MSLSGALMGAASRMLPPVNVSRSPRSLLRLALFMALVMPAVAYGSKGKKSKFLAAYPVLFKFFLFWWCAFVFGVMGVYIIDHLLFKRYGPAKVFWSAEHTFKGSGTRAAYWAQLVDPREWKTTHPVLQSANVRMVKIEDVPAKEEGEKEPAAAAEGDKAAGKDEAKPAETEAKAEDNQGPSITVKPVPFTALEPGLGLMLRHKEEGPRKGILFCTRECHVVETPDEGPWKLVMRTCEVGAGYPYLPHTEESTLEMWPPADDGSIRCTVHGSAAVTSRVFRWWTGAQKNTQQGTVAMLDAIAQEVEAPKKKD